MKIAAVQTIVSANPERQSDTNSPYTLRDRLKQFAFHPALHMVLLAGLVLACFGRTLSSYFLADDIGQVKYVSEICGGRLDLLLSNFTGNYMQIAGMSVYRPTLLLTLVLDYLVWHANAAGYYATNLLYLFGDSVLLYAVVAQLGRRWEPWRARLASFGAAALFVASPLHCESVSWVVGRVDAACCFYYLASLLCFLRSRSSVRLGWRIGGLVLFALSITVKEMAIGLPALLFVIGFFCPDEMNSLRVRLRDRFHAAWKMSSWMWGATAVYFVIRFLTLGTLLGGYTGSIGATQGENALARWLDIDTLHRIFFPFAHDVFSNPTSYSQCLLLCYGVFGSLLLFRALSGPMPWRLLMFAGLWTLTTLAPIYKLWGIGYNLEGARFCFFLSVAVSAAIPLLLLAPGSVLPIQVQRRIDAIIVGVLMLTTLILAKTTYSTNLAWVHAGKEVRFVAQSASKLDAQYNDERRMMLLGVPKEHVGAHMILNGDTLKMLLGRPLVEREFWQRFLTFDPMLFGPEQYVNASRLRRQLADASVIPCFFVWSSCDKRFVSVPPSNHEESKSGVCFEMPSFLRTASARAQGGSAVPYADGHAKFSFGQDNLVAYSVLAGDGVRLSGVKINPLDCDFLEFQYKSKGHLPVRFAAKWKGDRCNEKSYEQEILPLCVAYKDAPSSPEVWSTVRIRLSKYWRWFAAPSVTEVQLLLPPQDEMELRNLKLVSDSALVPVIRVKGATENTVGCFDLTRHAVLQTDTGSIPGATNVQFELSKCNFFFDNYDEVHEQSAVQRIERVKGTAAQFILHLKDLESSGYYQVRVRALDSFGNALGEYSDPVTFARN